MQETQETVTITDDNFSLYFFKAREDYTPKKGQCLARWSARADFVDDWIKRNVINLLSNHKAGAETADRLMTRLVNATERESIRVLREIAEDLKAGMAPEEVAAKPYRFTIEQMYWTKPEYVPFDPHWEVINIKDLRDDPNIKTEIIGLNKEDAEVIIVE